MVAMRVRDDPKIGVASVDAAGRDYGNFALKRNQASRMIRRTEFRPSRGGVGCTLDFALTLPS